VSWARVHACRSGHGEGPVGSPASSTSTRSDEIRTVTESAETLECLAGKRAGDDIASDENEIGAGLVDLGGHRLEGGQIAVDVVERGDAHG
jgi:hypothetical protein